MISYLLQELDLHDIISFDAELGTTLQELQALVCRKQYLESTGSYNPEELRFRGASIEDLCLDFSLPGYPEYILKPGDENVCHLPPFSGHWLYPSPTVHPSPICFVYCLFSTVPTLLKFTGGYK